MSRPTVVSRNDWTVLAPPSTGDWVPTTPVTVVIPAYQAQATLPLTLAALAEQDYPVDLLQVVVVDDAGDLEGLPAIRPLQTVLIRTDPRHGWGRAAACQSGADRADGDIVHWLDADMVPYRSHVRAQARWHEVCDHVVTLGYKRFVAAPLPDADQVARAVAADRADDLFAGVPTEGHGWVEAEIDRTRGLADAWPEAFRVHVGSTATVSRALLADAGGLDPRMKLGEDSELGYRLYNAGAVFVPEPEAKAWHLGPSTVMRQQSDVQRYNTPYITQRMPLPRFRRRGRSLRWEVPVCTVLVDVRGVGADVVLGCVEALLSGDTRDVTVHLVGDWQVLDDQRRSPLGDPCLEQRLISEWVRGDERIELAAPDGALDPAVPFVLRLPPQVRLGAGSMSRMLAFAAERGLGLLRVLVGDDRTADVEVRLERTASFNRAARLQLDGAPGGLLDLVGQVAGVRLADGADFDLTLERS